MNQTRVETLILLWISLVNALSRLTLSSDKKKSYSPRKFYVSAKKVSGLEEAIRIRSAQNWRFAAKQMLKKYPQDLVVHSYCVVAVDSTGRQIPMTFLKRVKEDFNKRYGGGKAATTQANNLNKEFGSKLKEHMQYCMDHLDEINKLAKVKAQVSEVKELNLY